MASKPRQDFKAAAARHWRDAEHLNQNNYRENADQLYGLAAECAVKSVLLKLSGASNRIKRAHIDKLWDQGNLFPLQKAYPALSSVLKSQNPFADWNVNQRYLEDGYVVDQAVARHQRYARRLLGVVK